MSMFHAPTIVRNRFGTSVPGTDSQRCHVFANEAAASGNRTMAVARIGPREQTLRRVVRESSGGLAATGPGGDRREAEVLSQLREHRTNAEIAEALFISVRTAAAASRARTRSDEAGRSPTGTVSPSGAVRLG